MTNDCMNWSIRISERGAPGEPSWQTETLELSNGCLCLFVHDFGQVVADYFGDDGDDNEIELWYTLSKTDSETFLKEIEVYGMTEKEATPIVKDKIKTGHDFKNMCKKLGRVLNFGSWH